MESSATATPARGLDEPGEASQTFLTPTGGTEDAGDAGRTAGSSSGNGNTLPGSLEIPAPHRLRTLAWIIDLLVVGSLTLTVAQVPRLVVVLGESAPPFRLGQVALYVVLLLILYHAALVWLTGQTVGKALLNLQVRRAGKAPGILWSGGRALGYLFVDVFGLGSALALFDRRHRCLHDVVFRSEVVFLGGSPLKAHVLLDRLVAFAERREQSLEEKKKRFSLLKGLLKYLVSLAVAVGWLLDRVARAEAAEAGAVPATSSAVAPSAVTSSAATSSAVTSSAATSSAAAAVSAVGLSIPSTVAVAIATTAVTVAALHAMPIPLIGREASETRVAGVMEGLEARPERLDFGNRPVGEARQAKAVRVANVGSTAFGVQAARIEGTGTADFRIWSDLCSGAKVDPKGSCVVEVVFDPQGPGDRTATLSIVRTGTGAPVEVPLTGTGTVPMPEPGTVASLLAQPSVVDFGNRPVRIASAPSMVTVSNAGIAGVEIRRIGIAGVHPDDFAVVSDGCSGQLAAEGGHCSIGVLFRPTAPGGRTASLVVEGGSGAQLTVALIGGGSAAVPDASPLVAITAPLDFGEQMEGTTSTPRSARIVNATPAPVIVRKTSITGALPGARPEFVIASDGCSGSALPPGETCTVEIRFTPDGLGGRSALLTVEHQSGAALTVPLTATATRAPQPSPSPSPSPSPIPPISGPDVLDPPPASVVESSQAGGAVNDHQQAFTERRRVVLPTDLAVDNGVIPAGTVVDSHMIFLNVPDEAPQRSSYNQTWTFDRPILGVMSDANGNLEVAASKLLGAPGTTYPAEPFPARGLDLPAESPLRGSGGVDGEGYTISGNRITVGMVVAQPGDWIRVVTAGRRSPTKAPPPSLSLSAASGAGVAGGVPSMALAPAARRRRGHAPTTPQ